MKAMLGSGTNCLPKATNLARIYLLVNALIVVKADCICSNLRLQISTKDRKFPQQMNHPANS